MEGKSRSDDKIKTPNALWSPPFSQGFESEASAVFLRLLIFSGVIESPHSSSCLPQPSCFFSSQPRPAPRLSASRKEVPYSHPLVPFELSLAPLSAGRPAAGDP